MNCKQAQQLLTLWISHDTNDAAQELALQSHLHLCSDCKHVLVRLQSALASLHDLATQPVHQEQPHLWERLQPRIAKWNMQHQHWHFRQLLPTLTMAASVLLMCSVALVPLVKRQFLVVQTQPQRNLFQTEDFQPRHHFPVHKQQREPYIPVPWNPAEQPANFPTPQADDESNYLKIR